MRVFKVGGGVLTGPGPIRRLGDVVPRGDCVLVVSAFGKTTNHLEEVVRACVGGDRRSARARLDAVVQWHRSCAEAVNVPWPRLGIDERISAVQAALAAPPEHPRMVSDFVVSLGEQLSSRIVAAFLAACDVPARWVDATSFIFTDDRFTEANVRWSRTARAIRAEVGRLLPAEVPVVPGFIGATVGGTPTTLGREGSDYTAALIGSELGATDVVLLKNVDGVLTADPCVVPDARPIRELSYEQAARLFRAGAKIVHPKTILPLRRVGTPLRVASFHDPDAGTVIGAHHSWGSGALRAIVGRSEDPSAASDTLSTRITVIGEPPIPPFLARRVEGVFEGMALRIRRRDSSRGTWVGVARGSRGEAAMRQLHRLLDATEEET